MDDLKLRVLLETDYGPMVRGYATGATATKGFAKTVEDQLDKVKRAFTGLDTGQKVLAGIGVGVGLLGTALVASIGPAVRFESAFAGVRKTVDGTPGQLNAIRDGLIGMSRVIPVAATDLADIAASAGQLGIKTPAILGFTETIAKLGATTDLVDFEDAAQSLARFINVTSAEQDDVSRLADVIVELGNNSATTESQIVTFAQRLAAGLNVVGVAPQEILAVGAAFSSMGVEAEAGASSLTQVFQVMADAAILGDDRLTVLADTAGVTTEEFARLARSTPTDAFVLFAEGLGETIRAGGSITPILESIGVEGIRTSRVLNLAALNSDQLSESLRLANEQWTAGGAAQTEFEARMATTAAKIEVLKNNFSALAIAIGSQALGALSSGLDLATTGLQRMEVILGPLSGDLLEFFQSLAKGILAVGGAVLVESGGLGAFVDLLVSLADVGSVALRSLNGLPDPILAIGVALAVLTRGRGVAALAQLATEAVLSGNALGVAAGAGSKFSASLSALIGGINPVTAGMVALAAAFYLNSRRLQEIEDAARSANASLVETLDQRIGGEEAGTFQAIRAIRDEISSLEGELQTSGGFWQQYWESATSIGGESEAKNRIERTQERIKLLNEELDDPSVKDYEISVATLARTLGISEAAVERAIIATGNFSVATDFSLSNLQRLSTEIGAYTNGQLGLSEAQIETANAVIEGTASLDQYAEALGISTESLRLLGAASDEIDLDALNGDAEAREETYLALSALVTVAERLAVAQNDGAAATQAQVDAMIAATTATLNLIAATSSLADSVAAVSSAQDALQYQATLLAEAQANVTTATEAYNEQADPTTVENLAKAFGDLNIAQQANATSVSDAEAGQRRLVQAFLDTIDTSQYTQAELDTLIAQFIVLAGDWTATLVADSKDATEDVDEYNAKLDAAARRILAQLALERLGVSDADLDAVIAKLQAIDSYGGSGGEPATADVAIDASYADAEMNRFQAVLELYDASQAEADALLNVNPALGEAEVIESRLDALDSREAIPTVGADITSALAQFGRAEEGADAYATGDYTASLDADSTNASAAQIGAVALLTAFKIADWTATIDADPRPAQAQIQYTAALARQYAGTYVATLVAEDRASATIRYILSLLGQFQSRTVTLTTVRRELTKNADGGIWSAGRPWTAFADGGMFPAGAAITPVPNQARIYGPHPVARIFAEAETGGEAFIPLGASKRHSALAVFDRVGQILGRFADGGVVGSVGPSVAGSSRAPTRVDVQVPVVINAAPGMDEARVADLVGVRVEMALDRVARDLDNGLMRG